MSAADGTPPLPDPRLGDAALRTASRRGTLALAGREVRRVTRLCQHRPMGVF